MERYTTFDLELASRFSSSICAIGVCVIENNRVVQTFYSRIKPVPFMMEQGNYKIHHLSLSSLENAPTFEQVWEKIEPFFNHTTIVAHNIQQDALALRSTLDFYGLTYPDCQMSCTFVLAKKLILDCPSYKLDGIAEYYHLKFSHHHALEDAMMCYRIIKKIKAQYHVRDLDDLHQLLHLDYGRMSDCYYKNVFNSDIMSNQNWQLESEKDPNHFLFHQCICLDAMHTSYVEMIKRYILNHGGFLQDKVNINTDYVIRYGNKETNNYKKALELKKRGQDIQIMTLKRFMTKIKKEGR